MTYRRRQTRDASLADWRSQTERLAAVRSIRLVRQSKAHDPKISGQIGPCFTRRPDLRRSRSHIGSVSFSCSVLQMRQQIRVV